MFTKDFQLKYLQEVGLQTTDRNGIREAYETAHRIREFEIELYWKRTAYVWAMQAALIGIAMFLRTGGETTVTISYFSLASTTTPTTSSLISILLVSTLAFVVAGLWLLLIEGAKFWHDNWERHVDILGEKLGENLYEVYPVINRGQVSFNGEVDAPFSVTKINNYVVCAFIWFWVFNLVWALWDLSVICASSGGIQLMLVFLGWALLYVLVAFLFCIQFKHSKAYTGFRMSNLGNPIEGLPRGKTDHALYSRRKSNS